MPSYVCHNVCQYQYYNPITGVEVCNRPRHKPCPDKPDLSNCCGEEVIDSPNGSICSYCLEPVDLDQF